MADPQIRDQEIVIVITINKKAAPFFGAAFLFSNKKLLFSSIAGRFHYPAKALPVRLNSVSSISAPLMLCTNLLLYSRMFGKPFR